MSIVMKNKLTATALAIATVMGMGYSAMASAADSVTFTTQINVDSVNVCTATTTAGDSGTTWSLAWTLDSAGQTKGSGVLSYNSSPTQPLEVKVSVDKGIAASCKLNNMTIATDMAASQVAAAGSAAYKVATSDGFWRYMPVVANVQLYTDDAFTTPATGAVTVHGADGNEYIVQTTAQHSGQSSYVPDTDLAWGGNDAVVLSDGYMNNGHGYAPLTYAGASPAVAFSKAGNAEDIKSVVVGVSSVIATNPEKPDGKTYVDAVHNGEQVSMPFTVNVTYY